MCIWHAQCKELSDAHGLRFLVYLDGHPATFTDVLTAWQDDEKFRETFNSMLADAPFSAFRWETPALSIAGMNAPFEFVLLDSPALARRPDPEAFGEYFQNSQRDIVVFPNLGGDAIMVVPRPIFEPSAYGNLAAFVRKAPKAQQQSLWQQVGKAALQRIGAKPIWVSTAGAGVSWLHVRLDDRPKYYGFKPYKQTDVSESGCDKSVE